MDPDLVHITALQEGDDNALAELLSLYKEPLFRYIVRYVGNESDAADITEETFVKVYFNAKKYRPKAKVKTWIFTIATNLCRDWHRRTVRHAIVNTSWTSDHDQTVSLVEQQPDKAPSVREQAQVEELDARLKQEIDHLPSKLKEAFILSVLEERPHEESGELLGVSAKTIEMRVYRARKLLKKRLSDYLAD